MEIRTKCINGLIFILTQIIETETEPPHSVVEDSSRDMELYASAVADHTQYEFPNPREVTFRDTLMYQTRAYR